MKYPIVPLGEVCDFVYGDGLKETERKGGNVPVYGSNGIVGWHDIAITEGETIIVGRKGSIGEVHLSKIPCWAIDTTYYIDKTKVPCDFTWLYYTLKALDLTRLNKSAAVPGLNREDAYEQKIPLPPLTEQKRIASLLARADRLRQRRRTAHELGDALLQSVFLEMFGDPFKHYHEKWKSVRFEEVTTRITYGFTNPMSHLSSGIPIITAKNVLDGQIDFENVHYADQKEYDALTLKNKPNKGDILITKDGTIGRCAIVDIDFPICINQSVALIQLNEKVISKYIFGYLYSSSVREFLDDMKKGVALQHLQITEFAQIPIPLPPLEVQEEFAGVVRRVESLRGRMSEAGRQVEGLFESLLAGSFG